MINTRTVFIVGAGASVPYGLPTGEGLLDAAKNIDIRSPTGFVLFEGGTDWQTRKANLLNFIGTAKQYRGPSIDAFLEDWPAFRETGHEVIAALMGPWANDARISRAQNKVDPRQDWLLYLAQRMRDKARTWERFCENPISFVTFNFDTVIEEEISEALHSFYGPAADSNKLPKVIHVHGRLPTFPGLTHQWVSDAAKRVKVVHDELDKKAVEEARKAILGAQVVCFLGMSYQAPNMDTLDCAELRSSTTDREFFGTTYKLAANEVAHARRWFPGLPTFRPETCREILEQSNVLRW